MTKKKVPKKLVAPAREPDYVVRENYYLTNPLVLRFWWEEKLWAFEGLGNASKFRLSWWIEVPILPVNVKVVEAYINWLAEKELLR